MRAPDRASANVQRRAHPLIDCQRLGADSGTYDIDHGIDGADFVKMDAVDGCVVNLRFGLAKRFKDADCGCFGAALIAAFSMILRMSVRLRP